MSFLIDYLVGTIGPHGFFWTIFEYGTIFPNQKNWEPIGHQYELAYPVKNMTQISPTP